MRQQLIQHIQRIFENIPNSADMQQEILQNSLDRYDDLISQGKSPEAAYQLAISGLGDLQELGVTAARKKPVWPILLVIGLVLGLILLLCLIPKGPAEDPTPTSPTSSTVPSDPTNPTDPTKPTTPNTTTYKITYDNPLTTSYMIDPLPTKAASGSIVTLKTHALTDVDLALYVNDEFITYQTTVEQGDQVYWLFSFIMPECNVTIRFRTVAFELTPEMRYQQAEALAEEGRLGEAAIAFSKLGDFLDSRERCLALWADLRTNQTVLSCQATLYGIRTDGTIIVHTSGTDPFPEASTWTQLCSIAGQNHMAGLRTDGTVVATGDNTYGQCEVQSWTDIVDIDCGSHFTVGLKNDGTVLLAGEMSNNLAEAKNWTGIVMIAAAGENLLGLRYDGTAVIVGNPDSEITQAPSLNNLIDIYLDHQRAIYLQADGTIKIMGNRLYIEDQKIPGLLTVESDGIYLAGMQLNGSMYFSGYGYGDLSNKGDLVVIVDYCMMKIALRSDGTLVRLFKYSETSAECPNWTDIMTP